MTAFSQITASVVKIYPFTSDQLDFFTTFLKLRTLEKKDLLIKPGKVCNFITYVNAGSLRQFTDADGKELTIHFFTEQMWAADAESFFTQQPGKNYIEATEETEVVTVSVIDFHTMMNKYPVFSILGSVMNNWSISTSRFTALSSMSPDERYSNLMSEHPEWINRFPQHQIASYLAMTPETLSHVRSRLYRN